MECIDTEIDIVERTRLETILKVLRRYVAGDHTAKRYTNRQRREDRERISRIEEKLKIQNNG